ncbi:MAG: protein translocase subunit SecF [Rubrivirga sp.]|jgi:preprotein translocase subunit SecF|nr:protein translocase subunit SecF [Rubrivirga sp.]|tara:strand:- start:105 stop:1274 length:1170 start_codon:yes stop_codon:yes gene_type:complete
MSSITNIGQRLYRGEVSYDFVGRWKRWYILSAIILLVAVASLAFRGLNLGIEFRGGADFAIPNATCSVTEAREVAEAESGGQTIVTVASSGTMRVQTIPLTSAESIELSESLGDVCGVAASEITVQVVGPTWGAEISSKALQGLVIFLVLVTIFLSIYFEWRMAIGALVALVHDLVITVGIYALLGLEVTPATAIGVLTILAYSLYDTVVVYDKVKENTRGIAGQSVMTYDEAANLAVNQTVVRSINTSLTSLLPVLAIIIVGAGLLGAGTLLDLAVALAVGMAAGTYSSIFIATPVLAQLKRQQPEMKALAARVQARRKQAAKVGAKGGDSAAGGAGDGAGATAGAASEKAGSATTASPASPEELRELARVQSGERHQPKRKSRRKRR